MNSHKNIKNVGITVAALSLIALVINFFTMYSLVANCPTGTDGCSAYSQWQIINKLGFFGLVTGTAFAAYGIVRLRNHK